MKHLVSIFLLCSLTSVFAKNRGYFLEDIERKINTINLLRSSDVSVESKNVSYCFYLSSKDYGVFQTTKLKHENNKPTRSIVHKGENISYAFCENIVNSKGSPLDTQVAVMEDGKIKKPLTVPIGTPSVWSLLDGTNTSKGFRIDFTPSKNNSEESVTYIMNCDANVTEVSEPKIAKTGNRYVFEFNSQYGCPDMTVYAVWNFIQRYYVFFACAMIAFGLFELFLGNYIAKATIVMITALTVIVFLFILIFQILPVKGNNTVVWVVLVISLILGLAVGVLIAVYANQIFGFVIGALCGYIGGLFVYNLLSRFITWHPDIIQWLIIIACMIILILFAIWAFDKILIIGTSFIGAYLFVRGISIFAGSFPNESTIIDMINEPEQLKELLNWKVYLYIAAIIILTFIGIYVQCILNSRKPKNGNDSKEDADRKYYNKI